MFWNQHELNFSELIDFLPLCSKNWVKKGKENKQIYRPVYIWVGVPPIESCFSIWSGSSGNLVFPYKSTLGPKNLNSAWSIYIEKFQRNLCSSILNIFLIFSIFFLSKLKEKHSFMGGPTPHKIKVSLWLC